MPRGSSATKRQHGAANNRDTRHENGLIDPKKRPTKQKSNGHLNGHAKADSNTSPPPPLPTTAPGTNGYVRHPSAADNSSSVDRKMHLESMRRSSVSGDSEFSSAESYHNTPSISISHENHRRIDVNAAKNPAVHRDLGPLGFALTVLRSCPLGDTIAILIVLLQIPPTFLSIIHLLFATLTFVPPSNSVNAGLSFPDIFEGTLGTPSVATILVIDFFVLLIWLFLWTPFQNVALDLAQTVIALTLGGGTSGREAGMNNVLVCLGIIGVSHFSRNGQSKNTGLKGLLPPSWKVMLSTTDSDSLEPIPDHKPQNAHGWIRSILAIHILTQGLVRYIRDWYVRREKRDSSATADPEVGRAVDPSLGPPTPSVPTQDVEPSPVNHSVVTSKKKRKHSALVRLRQPLWSALASTKIVMVKEYETSHTAAESAGTNATDVNNLGNAPFDTEADRIWITYVGLDEVLFSTSYFPSHTPPETPDKKCLDAGIDRTKPVFVRVNKTIWQLTRINVSTENESTGSETRWSGEIFGLAPNSNYQCEFISTTDGTTIFSTSVRTLQPPDVAVGLSPNPTFSGRPGSPITTLKTSIASSEIKLTEDRNRQKREKKEQLKKLNALRKEIERLGGNIASGGGNEDRQKQKLQQHLSQTKQAEEAIGNVEDEIHSLEVIPIDEKSSYTTEKRRFKAQRDQYQQARNVFNLAKETTKRDLQVLSNDITTIQQKRERMQTRIAKLNGDLERITDANARGLDEAQFKKRERENTEAERARMEMMYLERLEALRDKTTEVGGQLMGTNQAIVNLQQYEHFNQQLASPNASVPNLAAGFDGSMAENVMPGQLYGWNTPGGPFGNPGQFLPGMNSSPVPAPRRRGRSSSMLSNVSGFTQSSNEGPSQQQPSFSFQSPPVSVTNSAFPNAQASPFNSTLSNINPAANPWDDITNAKLNPAPLSNANSTSSSASNPIQPSSIRNSTPDRKFHLRNRQNSDGSNGSVVSSSGSGSSSSGPASIGNRNGNGNGNGKEVDRSPRNSPNVKPGSNGRIAKW